MKQLRILMLLPFAPNVEAPHGGGRSTAELLTRLGARHRVAALCLHRDGDPAASEEVRGSCEFLDVFEQRPIGDSPFERGRRRLRLAAALAGGRPMWVADSAIAALRTRLVERVRDWRPHVVQAEFHVMAQYLDAVSPGPALVVTEHEVGADAAADLARRKHGAARLLYAADAFAWRRYEAHALGHADRVVVFSETDRARLESATGVRAAIISLGSTVPPRPLDPLGTEGSSIVFVGNYMHPPNVEAALALMHGIFPRVRAQRTDARLYIVGPNVTAEMRQSMPEGITITGFVDDVAPYLDRAAAVCLPIRSGGGVRVKLLEAIAAGKAVVASRRAIEGFDLHDRRHVLLAESDAEFASALVEILADERLRTTLATNARNLAERTLGWDRAIGGYERIYDELLVERSRDAEGGLPG